MRSLFKLGVSALVMAVASEGAAVATEPHYVTQVPDLDPDGKVRVHPSGELKGHPVMRDETRDETLARLRQKYERGAASSDAFIANNSREMLDLLNLIDGQGDAQSKPVDLKPITNAVELFASDIDKLAKRVDKLETK